MIETPASVPQSAAAEMPDTPHTEIPVAQLAEPPELSPEVEARVKVIQEFAQWCSRFEDGASDAATLREGVTLARQRGEAMAELIALDPRQAIQAALPWQSRQMLPPEIQESLEQPVSGMGSYTVIVTSSLNGSPSRIYREATVNGTTYEAYVYGSKDGMRSQQSIFLHGVAIGNRLALNERAIRTLEAGESVPASAFKRTCPISKRPADFRGTPTFAETSGGLESFCGPTHAAAYNGEAGRSTSGWSVMAASSGGSTKSVLFIRVNFANDLTIPIDQSGAENLMADVAAWYDAASYHHTTLNTTFVPGVLTLPKTTTQYAGSAGTVIFADAAAAASAAGYPVNNYSLYVVYSIKIFGAPGFAYVGGSAAWVGSPNPRTTIHELGHCLGLWHANLWNTPDRSKVGFGTDNEYGDWFDVMGGASNQFNLVYKSYLGWVPNSFIPTLTTNGTYRIYAQDVASLVPGRSYGLRIPKTFERDYWAEVRQQLDNMNSDVYLQNGLLLRWDPSSHSTKFGSEIIDNEQIYNGGTGYDAPLLLGRTLSDPAAGLHFTPTARGGTGPDVWMDVVVKKGSFVGNRAPTVTLTPSQMSVGINVPVGFTITATDPDSDPLSYHWHFAGYPISDARVFSTNNATVSRAWDTAGNYEVRCTVSDMKGAVASANAFIRVGNPASSDNVTGRVTGSDGTGIEGVYIYCDVSGTTVSIPATSDSAGYYKITGLIPAANMKVRAIKAGYTFPAVDTTVVQTSYVANFVGTELPRVSIVANSSSVSEDCWENAGFTVFRTGPTTAPLNVSLIRGGTAQIDLDFTMVPRINPSPTGILIPAGVSAVNIPVQPIDDFPGQPSENPETLILALIENSSTQLWYPAEATLTIQNKTVEMAVGFSPSVTNLCESGIGDATITVTRTGSTNQALSVDLETQGSAVFGSQYQVLVNGLATSSRQFSIVIPAGRYTNSFAIRPLNTSAQEGMRSVLCTFRCSESYRRGTAATVWIHDDESQPLVSMVTDTISITEGSQNGFATATISRSQSCFAQPLAVSVATSGYAVRDDDYVVMVNGQPTSDNPFIVTIPAGQVTASYEIHALNDTLADGHKTFTASIISSPNYSVSAPASLNVSVQDDDSGATLVSVVASPAVVSEDCPGQAYFIFSRTGSTEDPLTVMVNGSGTDPETALEFGVDFDADFQLPSQGQSPYPFVIPAGAASATYMIRPRDDYSTAPNEPSETYTVNVSPFAAYQVSGSGSATITVENKNISTVVNLSSSPIYVCESGFDRTVDVFRTGPNTQALVVDLEIIGVPLVGLAYEIIVNGVSVLNPFFSVTIPIGADSASFLIRPRQNSLAQGGWSLSCNLRCSPGYRRGTTTMTPVLLLDDDVLPSVRIGSSADAILESSTSPVMLSVIRDNACLGQPLQVNLTTDGTAVRGIDYVIQVGGDTVSSQQFAVTIPAGLVSTSFSLTALNDTQKDLNKLVSCSVVASGAYNLGTPSSTNITLLDDELSSINISATAGAVTETAAGNAASFALTRSASPLMLPTGETINLMVLPTSGATLNADYTMSVNGTPITSTNFSVTFPPNVASISISLQAIDDPWREPTESVQIEVLPNANYRRAIIGRLISAVSIVDNEDHGDHLLLNVVPVDALAAEPDSGTDTGAFEFRRENGNGKAMTVSYAVTGTASPQHDYVRLPGLVTFAENQASVLVTVTPTDDTLYEGNETVRVSLNPVPNGSLGTMASAVVIIRSILDIGALPGQQDSFGLGVNASGTLVGSSGTQAFRDINRTLETGDDLHAAVSGFYGNSGVGTSIAYGITDADKVIGEWSAFGTTYAWYRGYYYSTPVFQNLAFSGATENHLRGVAPWGANSQGAGWSRVSGYDRFLHWFIYDTTPNYTYAYNIGNAYWPNYSSYALGVLDSRVIGYVAFSGGNQAVVWDWNNNSSGPIYLAKGNGDTRNEAYDIAAAGSSFKVVGYSGSASTKTACFWLYNIYGAPLTKLTNPLGWNSVATGVNSSGKIVGTIYQDTVPQSFDLRAALWDGTAFVDLYSLGLQSGWFLNNATKISTNGLITGYGIIDGQYRTFLMTP